MNLLIILFLSLMWFPLRNTIYYGKMRGNFYCVSTAIAWTSIFSCITIMVITCLKHAVGYI